MKMKKAAVVLCSNTAELRTRRKSIHKRHSQLFIKVDTYRTGNMFTAAVQCALIWLSKYVIPGCTDLYISLSV